MNAVNRFCFAMLIALGGFPETLSAADFELPKLTLDSLRNGDRIPAQAPLCFTGKLSMPLQGSVDLHLYQVQFDDWLLYAGRSHVDLDKEGRYQVRLYPASDGWKVGTLRVVASFSGLRQVRQSVDVQVQPVGARQNDFKPTFLPDELKPPTIVDPQLKVDSLNYAKNGVTLSDGANVVVSGNVLPPTSGYIEVRIHHTTSNGDRVALGGGTVPIRDAGYFMFDLSSHNGFWPAGSIQVETWVAQFPQAKSTNDIIIVARNPPAPLLPIKLPKPSNVIVDSSKNKHIVPMGKSFRIRGKTTGPMPNPLTPLEGPSVSISIQDQANITHNSASARSLKSEDGTYWFEVETVAPKIPGEYKLQLRIRKSQSNETENRSLELTVALPSDAT